MDVDQQIKTWAASKVGCDPSDVLDVYFTTISDGYCETCAYEIAGYRIEYRKNGRQCGHEVEANDESFADLIKEILAS